MDTVCYPRDVRSKRTLERYAKQYAGTAISGQAKNNAGGVTRFRRLLSSYAHMREATSEYLVVETGMVMVSGSVEDTCGFTVTWRKPQKPGRQGTQPPQPPRNTTQQRHASLFAVFYVTPVLRTGYVVMVEGLTCLHGCVQYGCCVVVGTLSWPWMSVGRMRDTALVRCEKSRLYAMVTARRSSNIF